MLYICMNYRTDVGGTALYLAANYGWDKTCRVLIDSGADVTIEERSNQVCVKRLGPRVIKCFFMFNSSEHENILPINV